VNALSVTDLHEDLQATVVALLGIGNKVYVPVSTHWHNLAGATWAWVESANGRRVIIGRGYFGGMYVHYPISPSREYGSSLVVWSTEPGQEYGVGMGSILDAVFVALESPTWVTSFANPGHPLENYWSPDGILERTQVEVIL
jgi:hypothetical protein